MRDTKANQLLMEYNEIMKENDNIYRRLAKEFGLSECAFWILYVLRIEKNAVTQSDICEVLYEPKQTVNSALKNMEMDGYIVLTNASDRRSKQVALTPKGTKLAEHTADQVIRAEQEAILALSETDREALIDLFHKYTAALKEKVSDIGGRK